MTNNSGTVFRAFPAAERRSVDRLDSRCRQVEFLHSSLPLLSPKRLLLLLAVSIFVAEASVMLLLASFPEMPVYLEAVIDSTALLIFLSPTFFYFHYRPLMIHYLERKEVVEQMCHSEERLNLALNAVNDGLWDWNVQTGDVYASVRASAILGFEPGELGNRIQPWAERLHPEDRDEVDRLFREHLEGKSDYYNAEHRMKNKQGGYVWVLSRGQVVSRDEEGKPLRMIGTYTDITLRKQAEEALRRSEGDIRRLSRTLMLNSEAEKKHLSRDLHDEFGQVLCAFQLGVEMLRDHNYGPPDQYEAQCNRLLSLVERLEIDLRHMCDHLRPMMLDDLGLVAALEWLTEQFAQLNPQVTTRFVGSDLRLFLPQEQEIALYRICQESLNNVGKYARADMVEVELALDETQVRLAIRDSGVGFSEDSIRRRKGGWGLGLLGMRERAAVIGAKMRINSAPGAGTAVEVDLPVRPAERTESMEVCI